MPTARTIETFRSQLLGRRLELLGKARDNAAYIALSLLVLVFWVAAGDRFMSARNWTYIAAQAPVLVIVAVAETYLITAGFIDLSVGSLLGVASFSAAWGVQYYGLWALSFGLVVGLCGGLINGTIFAYVRIPSFIVTLGMMVMLRAALQIVSGGEAIYLSDQASAITGYAKFDALGRFPTILLVSLAICAVGWLIYNKTVFGDDLKAMGGSERAVGLFGVKLNQRRVMVFAVGGLVVGLASLINLARIGAATPVTGTGMELEAISAVVLGGTPLTGGYGSIAKTVIGATALVVLSSGLTISGIPPSWNDVVRGLLLIVAIGIALDRRKIGTVK
jgi:ribose/xylose/arabinose/galactoside ABC-type transport system permease subunit